VQSVPLYLADEGCQFRKKPFYILAGGTVCRVEFADGGHEFGRASEYDLSGCLDFVPQLAKMRLYLLQGDLPAVVNMDEQGTIILHPNFFLIDFIDDALDRRVAGILLLSLFNTL
jgi:hypothetical protein